MRSTPRSLPSLRPPRARVLLTMLALASLAVLVTVAPAALRASASTVPPAPAGWSTVFSDSFSGSAGSGADSQWTYDTGTQYNGSGCAANWGTGEVESNTNSAANVALDGSGHLNITPVNSGGNWTSGRIETAADNFAAPAGGELEVSASIKQPGPANGLGYWPAFWMLGAGFRASGAGTSGTMTCSNWPSTGEIDVMEDVNALSEHSGTLHCGVDPGGPCNETTGLGSGLQSCPGCQTGYNTYSVIINRTNTSNESITWYLNGTAYFTATQSQVGTATWQAAVDHGFFLILDLAIGGGFPNGVCGCTSPSASTSSGAAMSVGYVAVYQTSGGSPSPTPTPTPSRTPTPTPSPTPTGRQCTTTATAGISADCYSAAQGSISVTAATGDSNPPGVDGNQVAQLASGDYLEYPGINFGSGSSQFDARVASGAAGGVSGLVEVVLDNPSNAPVGSFAVANTGGWSSWRTIPANITKVTGTHTVYLEFSSGAAGNPPYVSLHYFTFPVS
jgi:carbohydrate binding protein with CBM6 domain